MRPVTLMGTLTLTALLAACDSGSSGLSAPAAPSAPHLPTSPAFTATSVITPVATAAATSITVPLPPSAGYAGQAILPVASVPSNLQLTVTYANHPPAGVSLLDKSRQMEYAQRTVLDALSSDVVYACFAANQLVNVGPPKFSFVLPSGFAISSVVYNMAIQQDSQWTTGYGGPGTVVAGASSATVAVTGRFGFTIPANGVLCVALYGRSTTAPTPIPATPVPSASPTALPSASPTPLPSASPTPSPSPTPSAALEISPGTLSVVGVNASFAQSASVHETGYTGAFSITAKSCADIATVSPSAGSGPTLPLTVTGLAAGTCTATATDGFGQTAQLQISVTTSSVGVNAEQRKP